MAVLFTIVLVVFGQGAAAAEFIVGGQEVRATDPIQASTVGIFDPSSDGKSGSLCSGTLIRKNMALTAAHCFDRSGQQPVVLFGPDLHSPFAQRRQVEAVAINPKWRTHAGRGMDQGDIALVKFKGKMPDGFGAMPTVASEKEIHEGSVVTLAGYGISDARARTGAGRLRKTEVRVLKSRPGKSEMILDQTRGRGACHGDSGGPAFLKRAGRHVLVGVTNRAYPSHAPDDCRHKVIYTKVPNYRSWIEKSEKKLLERKSSPFPVQLAQNKKGPRGDTAVKHIQLSKHVSSARGKSPSARRAVYHTSRKTPSRARNPFRKLRRHRL